MREFFQVYCGAPELLMLTSRRFQHTAFLEELKEVTTMGQLGCVILVPGCGGAAVFFCQLRVRTTAECLSVCTCRSCNQDFTRRVRAFLDNCEHVHGKAPPPVSTEVIAGPKAFIDQCELLARWGLQ